MNASCADWLCDRVRRNISQRGAVSAALCVACAALGMACSEEQYNPPIGGGGSKTVAVAGSAGQSGNAGSSTNDGGSAGAAVGGAGNDGMAMKVYAFQSSLEGFFINYYCTGPAM